VNTIQENRLRGIVLALQCVRSPLADEIRKLRKSFIEIPTTTTQEIGTKFKTFTINSPIPDRLAREVFETLEIFSNCETGKDYRGVGGQSASDLVEAWRGFIS
jgi:hypothetical protein